MNRPFSIGPSAPISEHILALPLTSDERSNFKQLEQTVRAGIDQFEKVGNALLFIRTARLYRETHSTFEEYMKDVWGIGVRRAEQLIAGAGVVKQLTDAKHVSHLPNSRQASELAKAPEEMRCAIWEAIITDPIPKKITAARIRQEVLKLSPEQKKARAQDETARENRKSKETLSWVQRNWMELTEPHRRVFVSGRRDEVRAILDSLAPQEAIPPITSPGGSDAWVDQADYAEFLRNWNKLSSANRTKFIKSRTLERHLERTRETLVDKFEITASRLRKTP